MHKLAVLLGISVCAGSFPAAVSAHSIPWRAGESHQVGFGHCAKGPCTKRTYWGESKPHRHAGGKVVFDEIVNKLR